jgi:hypothetical protein
MPSANVSTVGDDAGVIFHERVNASAPAAGSIPSPCCRVRADDGAAARAAAAANRRESGIHVGQIPNFSA